MAFAVAGGIACREAIWTCVCQETESPCDSGSKLLGGVARWVLHYVFGGERLPGKVEFLSGGFAVNTTSLQVKVELGLCQQPVH